MAARNALLGLMLTALTVQVYAESSPIPVVSAGGERAPVPASRVVAASSPVSTLTVTENIAQPAGLLNQIETLQREVMELRGLVEEQVNAIERIQKENRDRYLDLDRRISQLASGQQANSANPSKPATTDVSGASASVAANVSVGMAEAAAEKAGEALYQDTFQLIRDRKFPEAIAGLKTYVERYPSGTFVDNAQYWLGEVYLAQGELKDAQAAFTQLVEKYPFSDKLADATYKLGQVYDRQGDRAKAREYLQKAINDFPGSSAARLADVYLRNLEG
ncbi:tol-pal system protein YbgF [Parendozoicomonas sp. Alg238-R29]|uniref:tol-pal system protein YbgF n=1 Tax=Parendozoicomonas sp. Alg238-R29 TaxID=2993446 RepID=UPI00248DDA51|nr:tol-pal system protein YbgF [Parendozoicomonas sp. Alg238-R29]